MGKRKRHLEQFHLMSRLSAESEERQVSTLLYTPREDTEGVLSSTNILEDNRKKYAEVMSKLDSFFYVRKNVICECVQFNQTMQLVDESIEQFVTNLYQLVECCEYGNLRDKMICDWASKNGPSGHINFDHIFHICCIITNDLLKLHK